MDKNKILKLLRLKKFKLEEAQMKLSLIEKQKHDLLLDIKSLDEKANKERQIGSKIPNVADALIKYLKRIELEKNEIHQKIESLDPEIEKAREEVNKAFVEQKSIEKIMEKITEKEKIDQARSEQKKLDEIVSNLETIS